MHNTTQKWNLYIEKHAATNYKLKDTNIPLTSVAMELY